MVTGALGMQEPLAQVNGATTAPAPTVPPAAYLTAAAAVPAIPLTFSSETLAVVPAADIPEIVAGPVVGAYDTLAKFTVSVMVPGPGRLASAALTVTFEAALPTVLLPKSMSKCMLALPVWA